LARRNAFNEENDGSDTIDWIGSRSWFCGKLAIVGASYPGNAAWAAVRSCRSKDCGLVGATPGGQRRLFELIDAAHIPGRFALGKYSAAILSASLHLNSVLRSSGCRLLPLSATERQVNPF
jgi:hypothetical protein